MASTRKRSASPLSPGDLSPDRQPTSVIKRNRTNDESNLLRVIPKAEAWEFNTNGNLLVDLREAMISKWARYMGNVNNYAASKSIFVLCLQGSTDLHCKILNDILPELCDISPHIQGAILRSQDIVLPSDHDVAKSSTPSSFGLPVISAVDATHNYFLQLGLLHPLGGGHQPLDSIVVIDTEGRRRLVLPFGWGVGKHISSEVGSESIQHMLIESLKKAISDLGAEEHLRDM